MYLYFTQYIETTPTYNQYDNDRRDTYTLLPGLRLRFPYELTLTAHLC